MKKMAKIEMRLWLAKAASVASRQYNLEKRTSERRRHRINEQWRIYESNEEISADSNIGHRKAKIIAKKSKQSGGNGGNRHHAPAQAKLSSAIG